MYSNNNFGNIGPPPGTHQGGLVEEATEDLPGFLQLSG